MPWPRSIKVLNKLQDLLHTYLVRPLQQFWYGLEHHITVWKAAWRHQNDQPKLNLPKGDEFEFLPAVLEVQETPASPLGRAIVWVIVSLFVLTVIWASFGKIDIVAVAQGKIIPSDHSKMIQPLEAGVVRVIHVKEGQRVNKGDVLIELDATITGADQERLIHEQLIAETDAARIRAIINGKHLIAPKGIDKAVLRIQRKMLKDQQDEFKARVEVAKLLIEQRLAAVSTTEENIKYLTEALPLLKERAGSAKNMADKKFLSRTQYLEVMEKYLDKAQQLAAYKQQLTQTTAALNEAKKQYQTITSEIDKNNHTELANAEAKAKSLSKEVIKAISRTGNQSLTAPIDGVVQQLAIHTIGGVVTPAQQLMMIIPEEDNYEVEAWVENKDIGFVDPKQIVEIKVEAFPFTKYGTIDGAVLHLSKDSVPLENVGYVYAARVSMAKSVMQVGNKVVKLSPGMNVSVEVKTGKRRVIEFFLSPLLRGVNETARER